MNAGMMQSPSWRYWLFGLLCLSAAPLMLFLRPQLAVLAAFDLAAIGYFLTLRPLFALDAAGIRKQAGRIDPERKILLALTAVVTLVILVAIATVLTEKKAHAYPVVLLCFATLAIAWFFSNMVYTLHYAHLFYASNGEADREGLAFPGTPQPDYWDFAYFAFTLGMAFQTSDVAITGKHMRKIATLQSLAAFCYNLGVLAFSVNILAGL